MRLLEMDAIIVGGGIVGSSAALTLARAGQQVALLERDFCGSHSSGVNYGGVRRQGRSLAQLPLSMRAHAIWGQLREWIGIDGEYARSGHLKLARSETDFDALRAYARRTQAFDLRLQLLERRELRQRFPGWATSPSVPRIAPRMATPTLALYRRRSPRRPGTAGPRCTSSARCLM